MELDRGIPRRVHACPECGLACPCAKGWRVLDADRNREVTELRAGECDCPHDSTYYARTMIKVLIVDQFSGVSPYNLQQHPVPFEELIDQVINGPQYSSIRKPEVREVPLDFKAEFLTTVLKADANGNAEVWTYNWDSSG